MYLLKLYSVTLCKMKGCKMLSRQKHGCVMLLTCLKLNCGHIYALIAVSKPDSKAMGPVVRIMCINHGTLPTRLKWYRNFDDKTAH